MISHMPDIDPESYIPIYQQIAVILRRQIEDGTLPAGKKVPTELALQQTYGVARETARRAIKVLRDEGLVITVRGKGSYVKPRQC